MNFVSDNFVGASAPVLDAIVRTNDRTLAAYGMDEITKDAEAKFCQIFKRQVDVFFVTTGTAANALALSAAVPPWGSALCHWESHVIDDECGAPEFFTHGAKLVGLAGVGAKLSGDSVASHLKGLSSAVSRMPPKALSIAQVNECGLVYGLDEISALSSVCRKYGLAFHMDGARFANALVAIGCSPAEMTWQQGVDILSFGATKNGCLMAEAVVVFDPALAETLAYRRKRAGQTLSKGRLIAAQFAGYFAEGHWLDNARHANRMAALLAEGLCALPGVRLAWPAEANQVFPIIPKVLDEALRAAGAAYRPRTGTSLPQGERVDHDEILIRLVTSFATTEAAIHSFLEVARSAVGRRAE